MIKETNNNNVYNKKAWFKFEREDLDFPFYNNNPYISIWKWILLVISPFFILFFIPSLPFGIDGFLKLILTLFVFGYISNGKFNLVFKRFQKGDFKFIIKIVIIGIFFSIAILTIVETLGMTVPENQISKLLDSLSFWIAFPFNILIEEFIKLGPFLAILAFLYQTTKLRRFSIIIATIITLGYFGLLHAESIETIIPSVIIIGIPSVLDVYAYIKTKNIMVTYLTHIFFNIVLYGISGIVALLI